MTTGTSLDLIRISGWLALVAGIGGAFVDPLWWALMPAAALLAGGLLMRPAFAAHGLSRFGAAALAAALVASLALTAVGLTRVSQLGYEPTWVAQWSVWTGLAIVIGAAILGIGLAARGRHSIALGTVVASALPLGLAIDSVTSRVLPSGIFFAEAGFSIGIFLFAISLIRLGRSESGRTRRRARQLRAASSPMQPDTLATNAP